MSSSKDEAATRPGGQAFAESPGLDCLQEGDLTTGLQSGPDEKTHAKECIAGLLCRRESCAAVSLINRAELRTARLAGAPPRQRRTCENLLRSRRKVLLSLQEYTDCHQKPEEQADGARNHAEPAQGPPCDATQDDAPQEQQ
jgi:hypothetical protein